LGEEGEEILLCRLPFLEGLSLWIAGIRDGREGRREGNESRGERRGGVSERQEERSEASARKLASLQVLWRGR